MLSPAIHSLVSGTQVRLKPSEPKDGGCEGQVLTEPPGCWKEVVIALGNTELRSFCGKEKHKGPGFPATSREFLPLGGRHEGKELKDLWQRKEDPEHEPRRLILPAPEDSEQVSSKTQDSPSRHWNNTLKKTWVPPESRHCCPPALESRV